jgi:hypothetical protein
MTLEEKYHQLYDRLLEEVAALHKANQQRIRTGMRALVIVTVGLLLLMFLAEGNRVFTLILWILSMFALSAYLIGVEYMDYELQKKLRDITQEEQETLGQLIALPQLSRTARLPQLLKWKGEEQAEEEAQGVQPTPAESDHRAVTLPMPEDGARPVVVDNPAAIPLDMDAILKSDPQKMAADLSRLAQVLQALSADLETRAAQEPSRKEVEE